MKLSLEFVADFFQVNSPTFFRETEDGLELSESFHEDGFLDLTGARIPLSKTNPILEAFQDNSNQAVLIDAGSSLFRGVIPGPECEAAIDRLEESHRGTAGVLALRVPEVGYICGGVDREPDLEAPRIVLSMIAVAVKELQMEAVRERSVRKSRMLHHLEVELRRIPMGRWREKLQIIVTRLAEIVEAERVAVLLSRRSIPRRALRTVAAYQSEGAVNGYGDPLHRRHYYALARLAYNRKEEFFLPRPAQWAQVDVPEDLRGRLAARGTLPGVFPAFYAGLIRIGARRDTQTDGALYVVSVRPFDSEDFSILHDMANLITGTVKDELVYKRESDLATRDSLTRLYNRRFFLKRAGDWFKVARRYGKRCSIIILDIDHFKSINDSHGHDCGDRALVELSRLLVTHLREVDIPARYGGEEFIILLPETDLAGAHNTAERIRVAVANSAFDCSGREIRFTASCGVASCGENSQLYGGETYAVRVENAELLVTGPGFRDRSIDLRFADANPRTISEALDALGRSDVPPGHIDNLTAVLSKVVTLEGMISVADMRLFRSKEQGRNRVTSGSW
jgi:diguanylate cyclase (GGDEF)-like protein